MKRGGPLKRRTPLKQTSSLNRDTPLKPVSKKRAAENRRRRNVIAQVLQTRTVCEAGHAIETIDRDHRCRRTPDDVHEPLTRARGGSITDPDNMVVICRACHDWVHTHPEAATSVGLLVHSYNGGYDALGEAVVDRGHGETVDDERRAHMASPQTSTTGQGDTRAMVRTSETSADTTSVADHSRSHTTGEGSTVET